MTTDLTPEHTARWQGIDKDLHPEVIAAYRYVASVRDFADAASSKLRAPLWSGWALREAFLAGCSHAARNALDQPEPEGLTEEELDYLWFEIDGGPDCCAWRPYARAVIAADRARWGRPAIEPETTSINHKSPA